MIGNYANHPFTHCVHFQLREANELNVVVLKPFWVLLPEWFAIDLFIGINLGLDHAPLFFEWPEYGGLPVTTRIGFSLTV